jgi:hypothetical protein
MLVALGNEASSLVVVVGAREEGMEHVEAGTLLPPVRAMELGSASTTTTEQAAWLMHVGIGKVLAPLGSSSTIMMLAHVSMDPASILTWGPIH